MSRSEARKPAPSSGNLTRPNSPSVVDTHRQTVKAGAVERVKLAVERLVMQTGPSEAGEVVLKPLELRRCEFLSQIQHFCARIAHLTLVRISSFRSRDETDYQFQQKEL